jgi:hypothetical protein
MPPAVPMGDAAPACRRRPYSARLALEKFIQLIENYNIFGRGPPIWRAARFRDSMAI